MSISAQQRQFIDGVLECKTQTEAAREAGYAHAKVAASRMMKNKKIVRVLENLKAGGEDMEKFECPIEFLKFIMNNYNEEPKLAVDAAKALLPYTYAKKGEIGKKQMDKEQAVKISNGIYKPLPPPTHLVMK